MQPSFTCLQPDELKKFIAGDMAPKRVDQIEDHLSTCEACRGSLEATVGDRAWWQDLESALRSDPSDGEYENSESKESACQQLTALLGPTDDPSMLGRIGAYEIVGLLGYGGMGAVFKGLDRSLNRFVAIKMLLPHLAASGAARKRFAREAQAVASVVDDHVMAIHCVDEWQGVPYLVMTYSRGASLQKRLNDSGPLELREVLRIGMQAAKGLAAAHAQGIVHRDIKPSNILLDQNVERVQLVDFGLARAVDDASLTCSGTLAGTPQYMSPEQARAETLDHRSDLFSLGSVLYAMCAGYAPFRADSSYSVLRLIIEKEPRSIREINSDIPDWLCAIIGKLMAKLAVDRFDSAKHVAELLEACLAHVQQPTKVSLPSSVAELVSLGSSTSVGNQAQTVPNADLKKKIRHRFVGPPIGKYLAAALAAAAMVLAGVVIVLELDKGTLTIKSVADDVPIRIVQGKDTVQELTVSKQGTTTRLRAGTYTVEIEADSTAYEIQGDNVTVKRGEETLVNISTEYVTAGTTSSDNSTGKAKPKVDASKAKPSISTSSRVAPQSDSLEGVWEGFYYGEGEVLADDKRLRVVFTNGKIAALTGKRMLWISDYTLESQYVPKRISYEFDGKPMRGIYEVKEDGLRLNTAELSDALPAKFATNYPEFKRVEGAQARELVEIVLSAARERGDDPLTHAIDQFNNRMLNTFLFHGQPPLTKDELVACASWKLEPDNERSETLKAGLTKIAQLHQLPDNWTIEGNSYVNDDPVPIHVFENYLQTDLPNERFVIRRRFLRPSNDYSPSPATKDHVGSTSLASAVEQFNARNAHFSGRKHPPLTEDEVVAAILHCQTMRDNYAAIGNGDWLFDRLQDIARTRQLPEGATIKGKSSFDGANGNQYRMLTIGIAMVGDKKHEGLTHMFEIRQQFISVDRKNGFPMPNNAGKILFPKEFHGSWRIRDAMTLTTKRPEYIDEVVVIDDNSLLLTAGESSNRYRLSYWKHRDDNQLIEVDLTAKSPDGNESKTFRCLMEIQGDVLTLLRQQNEHFPRPKSIDDISTSITRFTLVREKSGDKPTIYSPLDAIEISKRFATDDHGSAIRVKFRVESVHPPFVSRNDANFGHAKTDVHLDFRKLPTNFAEDQFLVVLTDEVIAQLKNLGIEDVELHFLNKEIEATGRVLSTMYTARGMRGDHFHLIVGDLKQIAFTKEQREPENKVSSRCNVEIIEIDRLKLAQNGIDLDLGDVDSQSSLISLKNAESFRALVRSLETKGLAAKVLSLSKRIASEQSGTMTAKIDPREFNLSLRPHIKLNAYTADLELRVTEPDLTSPEKTLTRSAEFDCEGKPDEILAMNVTKLFADDSNSKLVILLLTIDQRTNDALLPQ